MQLIVEQCQRYAKMRAHTATHLLHTQLAKIFKTTKQAGSLVDEDYLRFDFNADRLLSPEELHDIEKNINQMIYDAYTVEVKETSYDEAIKLWAKAFFEDKYGDVVRVVRVFTHDNEIVSIELCGWTHVTNTKDIWCFAIIGQEAVASGVKRITAVVWPKVAMRMYEVQDILDSTIVKLWIKTSTQLSDKLDKTLKEYDEMKAKIEWMETTMIKQILTWSDFSSWKDLDKVFLVPLELNFKNVVFQAKWMFEHQNVLIFNKEWWFVLLTDTWTSAKALAQRFGIVWWGTESMVQGKDEKVLKLFA